MFKKLVVKFGILIPSFLILSLSPYTTMAFADQNIEIVGGSAAGLPKIAVVNFSNDSQNIFADIIASDLGVTGEFNVARYSSADVVESSVQYIVTGMANESNITFSLSNNIGNSSKALVQQNFGFNSNSVRKAAHMSSNTIYKQLTNVSGVFTSKIAYILKQGNHYSIIVSDYDGYNQKTLLSAKAPIISLAWDNTGQQIAYVTYELGKPVVYVQDIYKVNRYITANFSGSNSSPAFTNSQSQLAVTLTKDYGSHIYLVNNQKFTSRSNAVNLINFGTIDTEASVGKNGAMVFTSNHDGGPQIFMTDMRGSAPARLTINLGNYNTSAKLSHDLSKITFVNRNYGVLKTYVMDLSSKSAYPVSLNSSLDMAPSFAPNDKLILFSSNGSMYIVNTLGTTQTKLHKISGNIIDQEWANTAIN
ncbi:MAG: TolB protein [Pseudomonadota bacterium]|nr:TolB protein [Pseudomonadota bacterium]